ncbi:hypothetical protein [Deinococcus navajonensis]|uniref:Uncharacterized protein n=1 Tax=Deinococcus navajonensis TaxID=309884 RepID=A0ABV8XI60_9DEIO
MTMNDQDLRPYVEALQERGCRVEQNSAGVYQVTLPDGAQVEQSSVAPHAEEPWAAVLDACDQLGLTVPLGE